MGGSSVPWWVPLAAAGTTALVALIVFIAGTAYGLWSERRRWAREDKLRIEQQQREDQLRRDQQQREDRYRLSLQRLDAYAELLDLAQRLFNRAVIDWAKEGAEPKTSDLVDQLTHRYSRVQMLCSAPVERPAWHLVNAAQKAFSYALDEDEKSSVRKDEVVKQMLDAEAVFVRAVRQELGVSPD